MKRERRLPVGTKVDIPRGHYAGHWGLVVRVDDYGYHVSGGSIGEGMAPVFNREELRVPRKKVLK